MGRDCCSSGHFKDKSILKGKKPSPSLSAPASRDVRPCTGSLWLGGMCAGAHAHCTVAWRDVRPCTRSLWLDSTADKIQSTDSHSVEEVGEVESNPVSKAIARHLGIDISAEGRLAKNRKGIAIIIHGTPLSGMRPSPRGDCHQRCHDSSLQNRGNISWDQGKA